MPAWIVVESTESRVAPFTAECKTAKSREEMIKAITVPNFSSVKRNIIPRISISATNPAVIEAVNPGMRNETGLMRIME